MTTTASCKSRRALLLFSSHPDKEVSRKGLRSRAESRKIYHHILLHLMSAATQASKNIDFDIIIASDSGDSKNLDRVFRELPGCSSYRFVEHQKRFFGEKLTDALQQLQNWGYQQSVIIGNDCLELDATAILDAFQRVARRETVIGPAPDGGFYLLGMPEIRSDLLSKIPWCTPGVLTALCHNLRVADIAAHLLAPRSDFDSFKVLKRILLQATAQRLKILFAQLQFMTCILFASFEYNTCPGPVSHVGLEYWQLPPPLHS